MATDDVKRTLDEALAGLREMHHSTTAELQKATEAEAQEYVKFLEAQIQSIAKISTCVEKATQGKTLPFA